MRKAIVFASALSLALAGPVWAQVKQGDLDLTFHTQAEIDFEVRDNYDFTDSPLATPGTNAREDFFVEQETRFWLDATAGPFGARVMIEEEDFWDSDVAEFDRDSTFNIEQAYGTYDFGFVKVQAGLAAFTLDPVGIVYNDDDYLLRLSKTFDWGDANFVWVFNQEGSDNAAARSNEDVYYFMANANIKTPVGLTVTPFWIYANKKDQITETGPAITFSGRPHDRTTANWFGAAAKGRVGPVDVLGQFTYVTGEQEYVSGTPLDVDISAWAGFLSVAYPVPGMPLTLEVAGVWMSGDDDPTDRDAEGYAGAFQDTEILNADGIYLDDEIVIRRKAGGVAAGAAGTAGLTTLTKDDLFSPGAGDFNFDASGGSALFNATDPADPGNFGIQYYHAAAHYKATPELTLSALFAHIRAMEDTLLGGEAEIGNEVGLKGAWRPHKYLTITPQVSWFIPGKAIENLVGDDESAFNFMLEAMFLF